MNTDKEFVSLVVDEIERRKRREHLRNLMSNTTYYIDKIDKQIKPLKSKIDRLTKSLKWWNMWYLSKRISKYQYEMHKLNDELALHQKALKTIIGIYEQVINNERKRQ